MSGELILYKLVHHGKKLEMKFHFQMIIKGLKCFTYNDNLYVMNNSSKKYNFSNGLYTLDILKLKPKSILAGMSRSNSFDDLITYVDSSINWVPISTNFVVPFP